MDRDQILALLNQNIHALRQRGVKGLALFGPAARNEGKTGSPVDLLLLLHPPHTFDHFLAVKNYLTDLLNHPVELVIGSPQDPAIRPFLDGDVVEVLGAGD